VLWYDLTNALQYLMSAALPSAAFCCAAATTGKPDTTPTTKQRFAIFMVLHSFTDRPLSGDWNVKWWRVVRREAFAHCTLRDAASTNCITAPAEMAQGV
jgi:hypothetical protein